MGRGNKAVYLHAVRLKFIPESDAYKARWLNRNGQPLVKGRAAEIVLLESLSSIGHVENVGRYCKSAHGEPELTAEAKIPIDHILSTVTALRAPAHRGRHEERALGKARDE